MARNLERIARVWDAIGSAEGSDNVGFCLDTCHAHAGGIPLATAVDAGPAITGRIDLVHCNDSRDEFDSGADRHTNLGEGLIDADELLPLPSGPPARRSSSRPAAASRASAPTSTGCASASDELSRPSGASRGTAGSASRGLSARCGPWVNAAVV